MSSVQMRQYPSGRTPTGYVEVTHEQAVMLAQSGVTVEFLRTDGRLGAKFLKRAVTDELAAGGYVGHRLFVRGGAA